MPKALLPVPETIESVLRPVVLDIARKVLHETGLSEDTQILFPGETERAKQVGSSINKKEHDVVEFTARDMLTIEVDEEYITDRLLSTAILRPENFYIVRDDKLEIGIKPIYRSTLTTLNFKFRSKDRTQAERWRDDIANRTSYERAERVHDVKYHYLIPNAFMAILTELHRLRENNAGYGEDFATYFAAIRGGRVHELTNQKGSVSRWGVAETQARIVGWFDFEGLPEKGAKEDDTDTWTISFSYKFQYDKPTEMIMMYPLVIHQQLLDQKWRPGDDEQPAYDEGSRMQVRPYSADSFSYFEAGRDIAGTATMDQGIALPAFDEFIPETIVSGTKRLFTALVGLDPAQPRFLMNLLDLSTRVWDEDVVCCLRKEFSAMYTPYRSLFCLSLYRSNQLQKAGLIRVDQDLNVYSTVDLDPREYYHLRLSLFTDLRTVPTASLDRLRFCGKGLIKLIDALDPSLKDNDQLPCLLGDNYVPKKCLEDAINHMKPNRGSLNGPVPMWTVQTLIIESDHAPH